jgi:hypothetical protein
MGITDVVNGDWRWIYDQATPNYKFWYTGMPHSASNANSKDRNCAMMLNNYGGKWYDYPCSKTNTLDNKKNYVKSFPRSGFINYIDC